MTPRSEVTVLRTGAEATRVPPWPNEPADARRWLLVDATCARVTVEVPAGCAAIWIARRSRLVVTTEHGPVVVPRGHAAVIDSGLAHRVEATAPVAHAVVGLLLSPRAAEAAARTAGTESAAPHLFGEVVPYGDLVTPFELDEIDRALDATPGTRTALVLEVVAARACAAQAAQYAPDIARCPGRTSRHRRHLFARLMRLRVLVGHGEERDYTMTELATVARMSVWHLVRTFSRVFGESPHRFLTRCRLTRAAEHLVESDLGIAELSQRLGFLNRCHFARAFRAQFGVSASAYRAHARAAAFDQRPFARDDGAVRSPLAYAAANEQVPQRAA